MPPTSLCFSFLISKPQTDNDGDDEDHDDEEEANQTYLQLTIIFSQKTASL